LFIQAVLLAFLPDFFYVGNASLLSLEEKILEY